jgi:hypothetical protein
MSNNECPISNIEVKTRPLYLLRHSTFDIQYSSVFSDIHDPVTK